MCMLCAMTRRRFFNATLAAAAIPVGAMAMPRQAAASLPPASTPASPVSRSTLTAAVSPAEPVAPTAVAVAATAGAAAAPGGTILGTGRHRYRVEPGWPKLPAGKSFVDAPAVCVDSRDNVYVFTRGSDPVMVFDRDGNYLRSWGMDIGFAGAHGADMGPDEHIYLTDHAGHSVRKCTLDGKVVLTVGTPGRAAERYSGKPFNLCTHTALSPQGDIYVSDGYGNAAVHKYSADGKYLFSWGESGTGPGQFQLPHNLACDADGWVYVADRENHRVQVFDGNGKYETQWNNIGRPCGLCLTRGREPLAIIGELGPHFVNSFSAGAPNVGPRVTIATLKGEILCHLGTRPLGEEPGQFIAPHGIAVDSRGDLYVAEVSNTYWPALFGTKPDHELRCLQKLTRLPDDATP